MREPIRDCRAKDVFKVAETMAKTTAEVGDGEPALSAGKYRLRFLHQSDSASTLLGLSSVTATIDEDTLFLSEEVSLRSAATDLWSGLSASLSSRDGASQLDKMAAELSASISALGRAAQASLEGHDGGRARRSTAWELAKASARAQRAVMSAEQLARTCAEAGSDVLVRSGGLRQLDKGWRRDALRAILALEQAPSQLQRECTPAPPPPPAYACATATARTHAIAHSSAASGFADGRLLHASARHGAPRCVSPLTLARLRRPDPRFVQ